MTSALKMSQRQKSNSLKRQNNNSTLAACFFYISLSPLHDYDVKMPSFTFFGGLKRATTNFPSLSELGYECKEFGFRIVRLHLVKLAKWNLSR